MTLLSMAEFCPGMWSARAAAVCESGRYVRRAGGQSTGDEPMLSIGVDWMKRAPWNGEAATYRLDRMLTQLELAGILGQAKATGLPSDSAATVSQLTPVDRDLVIELAGLIPGQVIRDVEHGPRWLLGL